jgi:N-glycosylase/DNA lyase
METVVWPAYRERRRLIRQRLREFAHVGQDPEASFYELCYCLCTPATKARHAIAVIEILRQRDFYRQPLSLEELEQLLHTPSHYIRFHRQKAQRLHRVPELFPHVWHLRHSGLPVGVLRRELVRTVPGLGMKEASHFLRNSGMRGLAVIDRHIVRWMQRCGLPARPPKSPREYEQMEMAFLHMAHRLGIPAEELDLLFWSLETGEVLR